MCLNSPCSCLTILCVKECITMKRTTRSSCSRNKESSSSSDLTIPDRNGKLPAKRSRLLANGIAHANASSSSSSSSTSTQKQSNSNVNDDEDESDVFVNGNRKGKEKDVIDADGLIKDEIIGPVRRNQRKQNDPGHLEDHDINSEPDSESSDGDNSTQSSSAPSTPENMPHLNFPGEESDKEPSEENDSEATEIASSYESNSEQLDVIDDESSNQSTIIMSSLEEEVEEGKKEAKEKEEEEGKNTEQDGLAEGANKINIHQYQIETNHKDSTAFAVRSPIIASLMVTRLEQQKRVLHQAEPTHHESETGQPEVEHPEAKQLEQGQLDQEQPDQEQLESGQPELEQPNLEQPESGQPVPILPQAQLSVVDLLNPTEINFMRCGVCLDLFPKLNDLTNHMQSSHSNYPTYCLFTRQGTFDESGEQETVLAATETIELPKQTKQHKKLMQQNHTFPLVSTGEHVFSADPASTVVVHDSTGQNAPNPTPTPTNHNYTTISLQCRLCPAFMTNEADLASHMNQSHRLDQFECHVAGCSAVFLSQADYQLHIDVNSAAHKSYACGVCSSAFATYHRLAQHYNITHEFGVFQCECGYTAESRIKMLSHQYMRTRK